MRSGALRTLYLHVGPDKTGTSAIQRVLSSLDSSAIHYPVTGRWSDGAHHLLVFALGGIRLHGKTDIPTFAAVAEDLRSELSASHGDVVISSEAFDPHSLADFLDRFAPLIRRRFERTVVLFVLREPVTRAASAYNQAVKDPVRRERREPDAFLLTDGPRFVEHGAIEGFRAVGGEIRVIGYDPAANFLTRFLREIGRHDLEIASPPWANRSMGGAALLACLIRNRLVPDLDGRIGFFEALRKDKPLRIWGPNAFPFSQEAVGRFRSQTDPAWALLERRFLEDRKVERSHPQRFVLTSAEVEGVWTAVRAIAASEEARTMVARLLDRFGR